VHACTDITGFGLANHASEMANGSNVTIEIDSKALPIIPGVLEIAAQNRSGNELQARAFPAGMEF
jgi:selenide,water dikinase